MYDSVVETIYIVFCSARIIMNRLLIWKAVQQRGGCQQEPKEINGYKELVSSQEDPEIKISMSMKCGKFHLIWTCNIVWRNSFKGLGRWEQALLGRDVSLGGEWQGHRPRRSFWVKEVSGLGWPWLQDMLGIWKKEGYDGGWLGLELWEINRDECLSLLQKEARSPNHQVWEGI